MDAEERIPWRRWRYPLEPYGAPTRGKREEDPTDGCSPVIWLESLPSDVKSHTTYIIKVNVGSTVVCQNKVPDRVRALNGILVSIERIHEPGVFLRDEVTGLFVCPELLPEKVSICT